MWTKASTPRGDNSITPRGGHSITSRESSPSPSSPGLSTSARRWRMPWSPKGKTKRFPAVPPQESNPTDRHGHISLEQLQQVQKREERRKMFEVFELRSRTSNLKLQHHQDQTEIDELSEERAELRCSNALLWTELKEARVAIDYYQYEKGRLSEALARQAELLASERKAGEKAEQELEGYYRTSNEQKALMPKLSGTETTVEIGSNSSIATGRNELVPVCVEETDPFLPDLVERVHESLLGTVSLWVKGMQVAFSTETKEALVLPWLLQKLFFLCAKLIDEKREELVTIFLGGIGEGVAEQGATKCMPADTSEFMYRHLRLHHRTLFPLSGASLRSATEKIVRVLAQCMLESKEWDPNAKDPDVVYQALGASGLDKIVQEYLQIMVFCCLQTNTVRFTDDLGEVQRFNAEIHLELINGDSASWGVVVFPGLIAAASGLGGEATVLGPRFVLPAKQPES